MSSCIASISRTLLCSSKTKNWQHNRLDIPQCCMRVIGHGSGYGYIEYVLFAMEKEPPDTKSRQRQEREHAVEMQYLTDGVDK